MSANVAAGLPAQLKKALEQHRDKADIADDDELSEIFLRLDTLNDKVAFYKQKIKQQRLG